MLPAITVPAPQAAAPPSPLNIAAVAPVPTQATANVVFQAVPANTSPVGLFNNVRGGSSTEPLLSDIELTGFTSRANSGSRESHGAFPSLGPSSNFIAQALSQSSERNANSIFSMLGYQQPRNPTPDEAVLERFALTKFLPSAASKPQPEAPSAPPTAPQQQAVPPADSTITARHAQALPTIIQVPNQTAQSAAASNTTPSTQTLHSRYTASRGDSSLVRRSGFDAYLAAFSRNLENLTTGGSESIRVTI